MKLPDDLNEQCVRLFRENSFVTEKYDAIEAIVRYCEKACEKRSKEYQRFGMTREREAVESANCANAIRREFGLEVRIDSGVDK